MAGMHVLTIQCHGLHACCTYDSVKNSKLTNDSQQVVKTHPNNVLHSSSNSYNVLCLMNNF